MGDNPSYLREGPGPEGIHMGQDRLVLNLTDLKMRPAGLCGNLGVVQKLGLIAGICRIIKVIHAEIMQEACPRGHALVGIHLPGQPPGQIGDIDAVLEAVGADVLTILLQTLKIRVREDVLHQYDIIRIHLLGKLNHIGR